METGDRKLGRGTILVLIVFNLFLAGLTVQEVRAGGGGGGDCDDPDDSQCHCFGDVCDENQPLGDKCLQGFEDYIDEATGDTIQLLDPTLEQDISGAWEMDGSTCKDAN